MSSTAEPEREAMTQVYYTTQIYTERKRFRTKNLSTEENAQQTTQFKQISRSKGKGRTYIKNTTWMLKQQRRATDVGINEIQTLTPGGKE